MTPLLFCTLKLFSSYLILLWLLGSKILSCAESNIITITNRIYATNATIRISSMPVITRSQKRVLGKLSVSDSTSITSPSVSCEEYTVKDLSTSSVSSTGQTSLCLVDDLTTSLPNHHSSSLSTSLSFENSSMLSEISKSWYWAESCWWLAFISSQFQNFELVYHGRGLRWTKF
jgi:hypothetical protein